MGMKGPDFLQDIYIIAIRWLRLAGQPSENVLVWRFEETFILIELGFTECSDLRLGEAAKQKIDLAYAAMPGAKENLSPARVETSIRV